VKPLPLAGQQKQIAFVEAFRLGGGKPNYFTHHSPLLNIIHKFENK